MNEKNEQVTKTLEMLRYQVKRYQAMKNGLMCQMLNTQIRRLENSLNLSTVAGNYKGYNR